MQPFAAVAHMTDPGFTTYRAFVVAYVLILPVYFYYRFVHTIVAPRGALGAYQWATCILELYGALCCVLMGFIRFRKPWADAVPQPPVVEPTEEAAARWSRRTARSKRTLTSCRAALGRARMTTHTRRDPEAHGRREGAQQI